MVKFQLKYIVEFLGRLLQKFFNKILRGISESIPGSVDIYLKTNF